MKRQITGVHRIRKSWLGLVFFASLSLVSAAHGGQSSRGIAEGYVTVSTVAAAESAKNGVLLGVDGEGNVTVHKGDMALKLGYSLPDLTKESGIGNRVTEHGILPAAGEIMVKLSLAF